MPDRWVAQFTKLFNRLKDRNLSTSAKDAELSKFKQYVATQTRDLPEEEGIRFINDLNSHIGNLVHSPNNYDRVAGLLVLEVLIDLDYDSNTGTKITRLANYLRTALETTDISVTSLAATCLGKLVQMEGTLAAECAEYELGRGLKWLGGGEGSLDKSEATRRHTAILMLKELAEHSPTSFFLHVKTFFEKMWNAFRDKTQVVREEAAKALRSALRLISQREDVCKPYFRHIYDQSARLLSQPKLDTVAAHGGLLVVGELLRQARSYLDDVFDNAVDMVIKFREHRDKLVRVAVIEVIPLVAKAKPDRFVARDIEMMMGHLLQSIRSDSEKKAAFLALGHTCVALRENALSLGRFLDAMMAGIKAALQPKRGHPVLEEALSCISMVASSLGPALNPYMHDLLPLMFQTGLSEALRKALTSLATHLPSLLPDIQERLLNSISLILAGRPFEALQADLLNPSSSHHGAASSRSGNMRGASSSHMGVGRKSGTFSTSTNPLAIMGPRLIPLALRTLASFDFETHHLITFVREVLLTFLEDDDATIREQAAITCTKLAVHPGETAPTSGKYAAFVGDIIEKLMMVGITDPIPSIRRTVLSCLDIRYDSLLAQAENLQSLFIALNDESFSIRESAITIIGRLAIRNPAYVMPALRKTLVQLLAELQFSGNARIKEESAKLLLNLIRSSERLMKPYVGTILATLMPKLKDEGPRVRTSVLAALGELSAVGSEEMRPHLPQVFPMIIETLQDQSSASNRAAALRALRQFSSHLGYVIQPYIDYPTLLEILLGLLKSDQQNSIRREILCVLGTLGAIDPYQLKIQRLKTQRKRLDPSQSLVRGPSFQLPRKFGKGFVPTADFYPGEALKRLMKIVADSSLSMHHQKVVHVMTYICKLLGNRCVRYLPEMVPLFLNSMREGDKGGVARDFLIQQIGILIPIVREHIRPYLDDVFGLIQKYWHSSLLLHILSLVEKLTNALDDEVKVFLPELMPGLLKALHSEEPDKRLKILSTFEVLGPHLDDYLHLVIPSIVKLFERPDIQEDDNVPASAIKTLGTLCSRLNLSDYASRITHPLLRILAGPHSPLHTVAMNTICMMLYQLGSDYAIFIPMVNKVLSSNRIHHTGYDALVSSLLKNQPMELPAGIDVPPLRKPVRMRASSSGGSNIASSSDTGADEDSDGGSDVDRSLSMRKSNIRKLRTNTETLRQAWETSHSSTRADWINWMRRLSVELLRESPSPALRSCLSLAQFYQPLARQLFNIAFISCWEELGESDRIQLSKNLKIALGAPMAPPEIIHILLDLAEFMEHHGINLPIETEMLSSLAENCRAYAKALHYKEYEFNRPLDKSKLIQSFISINNLLGQPEAAVGILAWARQQHNIELKESWYEKLHRWEEALSAYDRKQRENPQSMDITLGRMRCLHALGDWKRLAMLCSHTWNTNAKKHDIIAPMATAAVWNLGQWAEMRMYVDNIPAKTVLGSFFRTILAVHGNRYTEAQKYIDHARSLLDTDLTALVGESYHRAYEVICRVQQLTELEEVVEYKQLVEKDPRREDIKKIWRRRLEGCQRNVDVWQRILPVRSLVLSPHENVDMLIKFSSLCRKSGRLRASQKMLTTLLGGDPAHNPNAELPLDHPEVAYAYLKHLWSANAKQAALSKMRSFVEKIDGPQHAKLRARCYLEIGEMELTLVGDDLNPGNIQSILNSFKRATEFDSDWYRAWHAWALMNFQAVQHYEKNAQAAHSATKITTHLAPAIHGFFRSITLSPGQTLQDTLRLLTLWFKHGGQRVAALALREGFSAVRIDNWLQVIPQIIARIHSPLPQVREQVKELLHQVGKKHPQALVYPLAVAAGSQSGAGLESAKELLAGMRAHSDTLVEQAMLVSRELIRVSIIWPEIWHEALEDASRLYFTEGNADAMIERLEEVHALIRNDASTLREMSFLQSCGRDLDQAYSWCRRFLVTRDLADLNSAWDLYYVVFRGITKLLPRLKTLNLRYVSPELLAVKDLDLAMPGRYIAGKPVVRISKFDPELTVISSKQRPRKCTIYGSNGIEYTFLLKGHEDLRQDERVMQLFGLVNNLLAEDRDTSRHYLSIIRYAAVPLSPNSGLIGWVPNCDTLHALISRYRQAKGIPMRAEQMKIPQLVKTYDLLTLTQKVDVFQTAMGVTDGMDLHQALWYSSPNSETWLDRRTNYTRSLAVMSMVGYILGLGDRHPSNLMLERHTGKILHIDFGDCFEVAMHRDKYPETVPFRLTRMLISAMEVSGIEGNFRSTCESVMRVLRVSKESLMAVLEAFVHDPLINWRLVSEKSPDEGEDDNNKKSSNDDEDEQEAGTSNGAAASSNNNNQIHVEAVDPTGDSILESDPPANDAIMMSVRGGSIKPRNQKHSLGVGGTPEGDPSAAAEVLNARAVQVIERVSSKLRGTDFGNTEPLDVKDQVQKLILQATSHENLALLFQGWCAVF